MRPTLLLSLVLLFLLVKAHGIRLQTEFISVVHKNIHEVKTKMTEVETTGKSVDTGLFLCKDGQCSGVYLEKKIIQGSLRNLKSHRGRRRKLMTKTTSTTTSKTTNSGGSKLIPKLKHQPTDHVLNANKENFTVKLPKASKHGEATAGPYPDIIDIAGMDYSPARRKPPIHN